MKEFFGIDGYNREAEGFLSPEHLIFVTSLMIIMMACAVIVGRRYRGLDDKAKNRPLVVAALLIDFFEIFKIVFLCFRHENPMQWIYELPLFLCSIHLITMPLAAFSRGRIKEAALDFVLIFGVLSAVLGTYGAGNNYGTYPVLCFDNVVSGITHSLSGFASLYIAISGMTSLKKNNVPITFSILIGFCAAAGIANYVVDYNYMFLRRGDGTPYDIFYNLVGGHPILYPLCVVLLFVVYIAVFYLTYYLIKKKKSN
jgi:uncharacterized membrane protein YwaF